ncbi:uncharacterized protein LOC123307434 [Coccinella septempunctata]|uniref:uncharacterized protein LOC123307434 n=1 Tax=Coccinella septempunctata TaxID=41139 RepID=UPI001D063653|nr:uncharacterized protein LOC123307434 [Coccinella septempunctata]
MDWTNELTLYFLQLYRDEPCLWDPSHCNYKRKDQIVMAWQRLSESTGKSVAELKRKKESLMATFRAHSRRKKASIVDGAEGDQVYEPIWFAFSAMENFLGEIYGINTQDTIQIDSEPLDNVDQHSEESDYPQNITMSSSGTRKPSVKRRRTVVEPREVEENRNDIFHTKELISRIQEEDDECELYGKMMAKKLRRLPLWERQLLMYRMDGMVINMMERCGFAASMVAEASTNGCVSNFATISSPNLTEGQHEENLEVDSKAGIV